MTKQNSLLERLRNEEFPNNTQEFGELCIEAADEIERLRRLIESAKDVVSGNRPAISNRGEYARALLLDALNGTNKTDEGSPSEPEAHADGKRP